MAWTNKRRPASEYLPPHKAARILAAHHGICHDCGHGGAEQVDHLIPWAEWARTDLSVHDASNLAPIHGKPCSTCGRECHDTKSAAEAARGTQRRAARARRPREQHPGALGGVGGLPPAAQGRARRR